MAPERGLPPLFGFPWERRTEPGLALFLTDAGQAEEARLKRKVQWDAMGMHRLAGTEEEAEILAIFDAVQRDTLQDWLNTPVVGPIVRRRLIGLFEAGYLKSHSLRDI